MLIHLVAEQVRINIKTNCGFVGKKYIDVGVYDVYRVLY